MPQPPKNDLDSPKEATFENAPRLGEDQQIEKPSAEQFEAQSDDIFASMRNGINEGLTRQEAYERARNAYIRKEENLHLRSLSQVILDAPAFYSAEEDKKELEAKGMEQTDEYQQKKEELTEFNHSLRELIYDNPGALSKKKLRNWIEKSSGGHAVWTDTIVLGMGAEVAVKRVIEEISQIKDSEFSTTARDERKGIDIRFSKLNGEIYEVDAKAGGSQLEKGVVETRHRHIEIGIDSSDLQDDFTLTEEANSLIKRQIESYLKPKAA